MESFSGLGIGLSLVFGCVLLGLVAELYYFLWWRKRIASGGIQARYSKERFHMFCWKKPISVGSGKPQQQPANPATNPYASGIEPDLLQKGYDEEAVDLELMRLHNLCGPPRFLFTINEETKEDLESDDGKSRARSRSLSDFLLAVETPNLTPLASPKFMNHYGFNPLFESSAEAELNRLRSSPPPKFKFLRDAEEKLMRKLKEETETKAPFKDSSAEAKAIGEREDGSFLRILSTTSQVLPLASSPSAFRPIGDKQPVQK